MLDLYIFILLRFVAAVVFAVEILCTRFVLSIVVN